MVQGSKDTDYPPLLSQVMSKELDHQGSGQDSIYASMVCWHNRQRISQLHKPSERIFKAARAKLLKIHKRIFQILRLSENLQSEIRRECEDTFIVLEKMKNAKQERARKRDREINIFPDETQRSSP